MADLDGKRRITLSGEPATRESGRVLLGSGQTRRARRRSVQFTPAFLTGCLLDFRAFDKRAF
jgi:hypothetical protein